MTHEPIHYVPVSEQRYAEIIQDLEQHPARNQWSSADRYTLARHISELVYSAHNLGPGDIPIPMAVDRLLDVTQWLPGASWLLPSDFIALLESYIQPKADR